MRKDRKNEGVAKARLLPVAYATPSCLPFYL